MATVVLAGLIYFICEMYRDDCNVFAKDLDELVIRLRLIFERFRKHNIFVKANICFFDYRLRWQSLIFGKTKNVTRTNKPCNQKMCKLKYVSIHIIKEEGVLCNLIN
jgi:hypothetical protein